MSMVWLRQSTASQEIPLGKFVDSTDGDTAETGLTIANTDIKLWKSGATSLVDKNSGGATHMAGGEYYTVLDATDSNTLGPMKVSVHVSGALPVQVWCLVLPANVYDSLVAGSDLLDANASQIGGTSQTGRDIGASVLLSSGTGAGQISLSSGAVTVGTNNDKTGYTASTVSDKTGYSISGTITTLDALDTAQDTQHSTTQAAIAALNDFDPATESVTLAADAIDATAIAATGAGEIADAVWDEALSGHVTAGTTGERMGRIPNAAAGGNGGLPTVDASNYVAGIQGTLNTLDALDTAQDSQHSTTQSDVTAIKTKTDQLTFTVANQVDANAESINGTSVLGNGTSLNKWRGS